MNPEDINPYAAPQSNIKTSIPALLSEAPNAGLGKRFLNLLLDYAAFFGILLVVFFVLAVIEEIRGTPESETFLDDPSDLAAAIAFIAYYTVCEGFFGRSFGKLVTGTKVVTLSGAPLTFRSAMFRSLIRMVPFEPFSFFGSGFGNGMGLGWHDKWTSTRVVDLRARPVIKPRPMSAGNMPRIYTPQMPRPGNVPPPPPL